ncbi:MAG: class A beta-lactamase-related serine hydrolase [Candidatus Moduliflexus flocculans]|nr:class A beta-lactamase-related serine hydrolase [Candidatus Moduliflexus flocculans]
MALAALPLSSRELAFQVPRSRADLEKALRTGAGDVHGRLGILVKHVESGEAFGLREDERFQLASVFKIPVLLTLHKQIALGRLSLDDRVNFTERMKTFGSGLMSSMKPGLNISVQDLQLLMMARSDNTATDILYHLVTPEAIAATMAELGLRATTIDYDTRQLILAYLGLDPGKPLTIAELGAPARVRLGRSGPGRGRQGLRDLRPQHLDAAGDRPPAREVRPGRDRRPGRERPGPGGHEEPHRGRVRPPLSALLDRGRPRKGGSLWPKGTRSCWTRPSSGCRKRRGRW